MRFIFVRLEWSVRILIVMVTSLWLVSFASRAVATTYLHTLGSPGESISQGTTVFLSSPNTRFTTLRHLDGSLQIDIDGGQSWSLRLAPPPYGTLRTGRYDGATSARLLNLTMGPGIDFSGDGRHCIEAFGTFTIFEIALSAVGELDRLSVDFEQRCDHPEAVALNGAFRLNSSDETPPTENLITTPGIITVLPEKAESSGGGNANEGGAGGGGGGGGGGCVMGGIDAPDPMLVILALLAIAHRLIRRYSQRH
ncbi:MAG: JDVT-CTERM domain-containing protein [Burkholderiales bacterium]